MKTARPEKSVTEEERRDSNLKYLTNQLRSLFNRTYPYQQALDKVKTIKKNKAYFKCARCRQQYRKWNIEVDHITPMHKIQLDGQHYNFKIAKYVLHLFNEANLQVLCRSCHALKTFEGKQK